MSTNDFLKKQNIDLLWEVIIDDDLFKNKPKELINKISNIFSQNLRGFNEAEKNNSTNLTNMNKKFIRLIMDYTNNIIYETLQKKQNQKEVITSSDLQLERITQFEKDLSQKQTEFTNAMSLPVPPVPKFSDNNIDEPIGEMELAIKKVLEQRNYDIEQVSKNLNKSNADSWLKSQETSLKSEKILPTIKPKMEINSVKYIKIDNEPIENSIIKKDIIDLSRKKQISWEDENINLQIIEVENKVNEDDIFKKLKKIAPRNTDSLNININDRMNILEDKLEGLNNKVDLILKLLQS